MNQLPTILAGVVKPYKGNGRKLGYPTANIDVPTDIADGVYFGHATLDGLDDIPAVIFIGIPTTLGDDLRRVEAHLFDIPDIDYYGQQLHVNVEKFHRDSRTFSSVEELLSAMRTDDIEARKWTTEHPVRGRASTG